MFDDDDDACDDDEGLGQLGTAIVATVVGGLILMALGRALSQRTAPPPPPMQLPPGGQT